jgi:hypothetical protein
MSHLIVEHLLPGAVEHNLTKMPNLHQARQQVIHISFFCSLEEERHYDKSSRLFRSGSIARDAGRAVVAARSIRSKDNDRKQSNQ